MLLFGLYDLVYDSEPDSDPDPESKPDPDSSSLLEYGIGLAIEYETIEMINKMIFILFYFFLLKGLFVNINFRILKINLIYNGRTKEKGYIIFRREIPQERVEYGRQQINNKVNYYRLKGFIDNDLMKRANIRLNTNLDYLKYRVSNNNNSSDAGGFHRDIHSYAGVPEIYTC